MRRGPRYFAEITALLSFAALCISASIFLGATLPKAMRALDGANTALATVNRPCKSDGSSCGTLAGVQHAMIKLQSAGSEMASLSCPARDLLISTKNAVNSSSLDLHTQMSAAGSLIGNGNLAVAQLNADLVSVNSAIRRLSAFETSANSEILAAKSATDTFNHLIQSQYVTNTLASAAGIAKSWNGISANALEVTNRFVHPPKCRNFRCRVGRIWSYLPVASRGFELYNDVTQAFGGTQINGTVKVEK